MSPWTQFYRLLLACAAAVVLLSSEAWGWDCGRWNLPSTPAQYFGYGYGPGHHAPIVRMPCCHPEQGPRITFSPGCPQPQCYACGFASGGSSMYRELESPAEAVPTPAPPLQEQPSQSRRVLSNTFMR